MSCTFRLILIAALALAFTASCGEAAPFFDAIYDAISGNGRRSYGYGYGDYGYNGGYGYGHERRQAQPAPRAGKSYKEICRVHHPDAVAFPGSGGIVCPY